MLEESGENVLDGQIGEGSSQTRDVKRTVWKIIIKRRKKWIRLMIHTLIEGRMDGKEEREDRGDSFCVRW